MDPRPMNPKSTVLPPISGHKCCVHPVTTVVDVLAAATGVNLGSVPAISPRLRKSHIAPAHGAAQLSPTAGMARHRERRFVVVSARARSPDFGRPLRRV